MVATDKVAVKVKDEPAFSAIEDAEDVKVTVGALSFSVIVIVTDCGVPLSLADPPETLSIATIPVSFPSPSDYVGDNHERALDTLYYRWLHDSYVYSHQKHYEEKQSLQVTFS